MKRRAPGCAEECRQRCQSATIHLASHGEIVQVYKEQMQSQVVGPIQGVVPRERDIYKLAALMGRVLEESTEGALQSGF